MSGRTHSAPVSSVGKLNKAEEALPIFLCPCLSYSSLKYLIVQMLKAQNNRLFTVSCLHSVHAQIFLYSVYVVDVILVLCFQ